MTHDSKISAFFDHRAIDSNALYQEALLGDIARQVIEAMAVKPGEQMIDLGCGVGWATKRLGKKAPGAQAVGIDASPAMISRADAETDWTSRARFERMPMESLDFPDARFDHAFAIDALDYVEDPTRALTEVARVMKPGARLELVVRRFGESPATEGWSKAVGVDLPWMSAAEWDDTVRSAGFTIEASSRIRDAREEIPFEESPFAAERSEHDAQSEAGAHWIRAVR